MKLIKLIALVLLIAGLASCGLFKKVSTETNRERVSIKTDSVYSSTVTDKSKTVITEKADGTVETNPVSIEAEKPALIDSTGIVTSVLDTLMFRVKVSYDKLSRSVKFDIKKLAELIPVKIDRVTITNNDISATSQGKVTSKTKTATSEKTKISEPDYTVIYTVIGSVILVFIGVWLFIKYKIKTVI